MRTRERLASLIAVGSLLWAGASAQAVANSVLTDAFVARARPAIDYLDRSSRLALDRSRSAGLRRFAHRQALEQTIAANSLVAWTQANTLAGTAVPLGTPVIAVVPAPAEPVPVVAGPAADLSADASGVVTGRSAAVEGRPLTVTRAPRQSIAPSDGSGVSGDFARLSDLEGRAFDTYYVDTQRDSLRSLASLYDDYRRRGDDPGLRAMAVRELPKINRRLAELRGF